MTRGHKVMTPALAGDMTGGRGKCDLRGSRPGPKKYAKRISQGAAMGRPRLPQPPVMLA